MQEAWAWLRCALLRTFQLHSNFLPALVQGRGGSHLWILAPPTRIRISEPLASSQGTCELLNRQESANYKGLESQPGIHPREWQTSQQASRCITQAPCTQVQSTGTMYACAQEDGLLAPGSGTTRSDHMEGKLRRRWGQMSGAIWEPGYPCGVLRLECNKY